MTAPFEASVAISKGVKPIANGGWLWLGDGQLRLFDGKGEIVAEAPTDRVWAKGKLATMGSGVALWVGEDKFMISPGSGNRPAFFVPTGAGIGASSVAHGRKFAKELYAALEAAGGHLGKPS
jgi:hypothetical protein